MIALLCITTNAQQLNRPIGQYPGNPSEYYGPTLVQDNSYRDIALHRMVYQSSSWDFNLTSQLLTDGIIDEHLPAWLNVTTPEGQLPPHKREACIDGNEWTSNIVMGGNTWLQYDWENMAIDIDEVEMVCNMAYREEAPKGFKIRLLTSTDGKKWKVADEWMGEDLPGKASRSKASRSRVHSDPNKNSGDDLLPTRNIDHTFHLKKGKAFSHMKLEMVTPSAVHWTITELKLLKDGKRAKGILPAEHFVSAWRSLGNHDEWVTVDLGAIADFYRIHLYWVNSPKSGNIQVSDDNANWRTVAQLSQKSLPFKEGIQLITLPEEAHGRYVRINMIEPNKNGQPFCLKEIGIDGQNGGMCAVPHEAGGWQDGKWLLNGGDWQLTRASHPDAKPLVATVPATVLSSYVNAGALPDMNHDDNLMLSSESFFDGDFIYKRSFDLPKEMQGKRVFLNFDGINWQRTLHRPSHADRHRESTTHCKFHFHYRMPR